MTDTSDRKNRPNSSFVKRALFVSVKLHPAVWFSTDTFNTLSLTGACFAFSAAVTAVPCSQTRGMIGTLVNIRRGGRSPPLIMVALVTCILLFGFNYWVSSSRNVELQVCFVWFLTECEGYLLKNRTKHFSVFPFMLSNFSMNENMMKSDSVSQAVDVCVGLETQQLCLHCIVSHRL